VAKKRNPRVDRAVRDALADLIASELEDPRLQFVSFTEVHVTPDHDHATVYYTTLDEDIVTRPERGEDVPEEDAAAAGLASAAPRIQGLLSRHVRLRNTPTLSFEPDEAAAEGRRIEELLRQIRSEEDDDAPGDASGAAP
jgi:ribosome-binding factor A